MNQRIHVNLFAATLLLSAFLLFIVQPMFGKMILPMLGGAPAVWNTAMVFFQAALLGGYLYAHLLSRFSKKTQAIIHIIVLAAFACALPIAIPAGWEPPATDNPSFWQIRLMAVAVGGPFFALSATAPLLQHWFSRSGHEHAENPYFLYGASNIGSLGALLLYPVLFEPLLTLHQQSVSWTAGYGLLALLILLCATIREVAPANITPQAQDTTTETLTTGRIMLWLLLAFIPSSLMLGVTTFITTDLASAPLLWIIPLAIYVGTFIIAFARQWPVKLEYVLIAQGVLFAAVVGLFLAGSVDSAFRVVVLHLGLFALTALFCHMQLASLRPRAEHLTAFYLTMSLGGVLGGIFNALIAPVYFTIPIEYALVLGVSAFLRYLTDPNQSLKALRRNLNGNNGFAAIGIFIVATALFLWILMLPLAKMRFMLSAATALALALLSGRRWMLAGLAAIILMAHPGYNWDFDHKVLLWQRNFFGVMRVVNSRTGQRYFMHGTTVHGAQPLDEAHKLTPVSYYYNQGTPASQVFALLDSRPGPQRIADLGLGIGTITCYQHPGRSVDFYEIDPDVQTIAENRKFFTYLSDCGTPYTVIIGDGRLKIAKAPDHSYDLIFLDAFSSDNIPVHLLTREAFALYLRKLKPDGLIAINTTNRHLDLNPVVATAARDLGVRSLFHSHGDGVVQGTHIPFAGSLFAVIAPQQDTIEKLLRYGWHPLSYDPAKKAWRDDFSNIIGAIRWKPPVADD
ncbi:MAG TPA: fused MFS/spermidine synthase [Patescibacteria group bacterium]|nr:fused MFS/spermidine synthase [Patescibacteria group bacterium]